MFGTYRLGKPMNDCRNESLMINGHGHRLSHFNMSSQHRVCEVEKQSQEVRTRRATDKRIVVETLEGLRIAAHLLRVDVIVTNQWNRLANP